MNGHTLIDLRALDAQERGNAPMPESIPYDITPDDPLVEAIRVHTDVVRDLANARELR